jgi:hypothetical protein
MYDAISDSIAAASSTVVLGVAAFFMCHSSHAKTRWLNPPRERIRDEVHGDEPATVLLEQLAHAHEVAMLEIMQRAQLLLEVRERQRGRSPQLLQCYPL